MKTKPPQPTTEMVSKFELAAALGVSPNQINEYAAKGMPVAIRGKQGVPNQYNLEEAVSWVSENIGRSVETESLSEARLRKLQAEASLVELALQKERGEVIEIAEVTKEIASVLSNVRAKLLSIPTKASGLLVGSKSQIEIRTILDDQIREVLEELSSSSFTEITDSNNA